jgi:hypothetical protein
MLGAVAGRVALNAMLESNYADNPKIWLGQFWDTEVDAPL